MELREIIQKNRSYRRFDEKHAIDKATLIDLIDLARHAASARNAQPLKYLLSNTPDQNQKIFETLSWAAALKDWDGPIPGERPTAYIVVLKDTSITENIFCDDGLAMQNILLGAVDNGLGGCIFRSINKPKLRKALELKLNLEIVDVIALGLPVEKVEIVDVKDNDVKYYRGENQVHYVPKRSLNEIIIK